MQAMTEEERERYELRVKFMLALAGNAFIADQVMKQFKYDSDRAAAIRHLADQLMEAACKS